MPSEQMFFFVVTLLCLHLSTPVYYLENWTEESPNQFDTLRLDSRTTHKMDDTSNLPRIEVNPKSRNKAAKRVADSMASFIQLGEEIENRRSKHRAQSGLGMEYAAIPMLPHRGVRVKAKFCQICTMTMDMDATAAALTDHMAYAMKEAQLFGRREVIKSELQRSKREAEGRLIRGANGGTGDPFYGTESDNPERLKADSAERECLKLSNKTERDKCLAQAHIPGENGSPNLQTAKDVAQARNPREPNRSVVDVKDGLSDDAEANPIKIMSKAQREQAEFEDARNSEAEQKRRNEQTKKDEALLKRDNQRSKTAKEQRAACNKKFKTPKSKWDCIVLKCTEIYSDDNSGKKGCIPPEPKDSFRFQSKEELKNIWVQQHPNTEKDLLGLDGLAEEWERQNKMSTMVQNIQNDPYMKRFNAKTVYLETSAEINLSDLPHTVKNEHLMDPSLDKGKPMWDMDTNHGTGFEDQGATNNSARVDSNGNPTNAGAMSNGSMQITEMFVCVNENNKMLLNALFLGIASPEVTVECVDAYEAIAENNTEVALEDAKNEEMEKSKKEQKEKTEKEKKICSTIETDTLCDIEEMCIFDKGTNKCVIVGSKLHDTPGIIWAGGSVCDTVKNLDTAEACENAAGGCVYDYSENTCSGAEICTTVEDRDLLSDVVCLAIVGACIYDDEKKLCDVSKYTRNPSLGEREAKEARDNYVEKGEIYAPNQQGFLFPGKWKSKPEEANILRLPPEAKTTTNSDLLTWYEEKQLKEAHEMNTGNVPNKYKETKESAETADHLV